MALKHFIMPETPAGEVGPVTVDTVEVAGRVVKLSRPAMPERLLELGSVSDAYVADEYMPYWATLWPVAKYLSGEILKETWPPGLHAIELGCGLALPGIAALHAGMDVTFSDYDATALRFAVENARLNGFPRARSVLLDWRHPPADTYDVIIASDLIYEERNVEPLVALFKVMLAPGGIVLMADQDRAYAKRFLWLAGQNGLRHEARPFVADPVAGREVTGTVYRLTRSQ